jgi:hypothetical protein
MKSLKEKYDEEWARIVVVEPVKEEKKTDTRSITFATYRTLNDTFYDNFYEIEATAREILKEKAVEPTKIASRESRDLYYNKDISEDCE